MLTCKVFCVPDTKEDLRLEFDAGDGMDFLPALFFTWILVSDQ